MKKIFSLFFMFLPSAGMLLAQDTLKIDFNGAVKMALDKNVQLQEQRNNLESSIAQKNQSMGAFLPDISAYSGFNRTIGLQFSQITGELYTEPSNYISSSITAGYRIFNGFGKINSLRNAEKMVESQLNNVEASRQQTIYNVASQYLQVLLDREILRIDNENLNYQKTTLEQIRGFVSLGTHPKSDELTQVAQVKKFDVTRIRDENTFRLDKAKLSQTLLVEPGIQIDPQEPDWGFDALLAEDYNLNDLYQSALLNRPDYKKNQNDQEAAQAFLGMARSYLYPTVDLYYQYGTSYYSLNTDPVNHNLIPFSDQYFKTNKQTQYGVQVNIPIFSQFRTIALKTQRKMLLENSKLVEDNSRYTIFQDVQTAYQNLKAAKDEYLATQAQFEAAIEAKKIQQESYELGVSDLVQLSQAIQTYVEAASSKAQAQYRLLFQNVMLNYALGTLNQDNLH